MAPSWTVKDSGGPAIFQPVKSFPLNRLVKPGSTAGAPACAAAARATRTSDVSFMVPQSTIDDAADGSALTAPSRSGSRCGACRGALRAERSRVEHSRRETSIMARLVTLHAIVLADADQERPHR